MMNKGYVGILWGGLVAGLTIGFLAAGAQTRNDRPWQCQEARKNGAPLGFLKPIEGWLPVSAEDPRPAFDVRCCRFAQEIYDLAPRPDTVPVLEEPLFVPAEEAGWLRDKDLVLGLKIGLEAHCYPLCILHYHSLIIDRIGGQSVYVFWDPPSGLALARRQWAQWRPLRLAGLGFRGVSLAFDPASGALWDLFGGGPLSAPGKGFSPPLPQDYQWLPLERLTWRAWRQEHPQTFVLSLQTGYPYDYSRDPYAAALSPQGQIEDYWESETVLAPPALYADCAPLRPKTPVIGFLLGAREAPEAWAVPLTEATISTPGKRSATIAHTPIVFFADPAADRYYVMDAAGHWLPQVRLFWFAWKARFSKSRIWMPSLSADARPHITRNKNKQEETPEASP